MRWVFHRDFERQFKRLRRNEQKRVEERLVLFSLDAFNPVLNNHPLHGKYAGYRSINIAGDLRALYKLQKADLCIFVKIGMHGTLYRS